MDMMGIALPTLSKGRTLHTVGNSSVACPDLENVAKKIHGNSELDNRSYCNGWPTFDGQTKLAQPYLGDLPMGLTVHP